MGKRLLGLSMVILSFFYTGVIEAEELMLDRARTEVIFSPGGQVIETIIKEIDKAKSEILIQAYSFTDKKIANALIRAFERHVNVAVILDKGQKKEKRSMASVLSRSGISIFMDAQHSTAHNKVMIIDGSIVATGSCNYIKAAEDDNAENLLIINAKELAGLYKANWEKHRTHSDLHKSKEKD